MRFRELKQANRGVSPEEPPHQLQCAKTQFAQDNSAEVDGMPRSARASGCVDFVLSPDKIPDELQRLVVTSMNKRA
jgi:hypothetical protein